MDRNKVILVGLLLIAGVGFYLLRIRTTSHFEPPERQGPPALVARGDAAAFWVLLKREERRQIVTGGGRFETPTIHIETFYHFELHEHDPASGRPVWNRSLLIVHEKEGGHSAQARILGQDGDAVWLFIHDRPVAVSVQDGSMLIDRAGLEERNPTLRDLIPAELRFYTYLGGLVITAADARHYLVKAPEYLARPYIPPDAETFRQANFMSTTWNGGYHTSDFLVRQGTIGGRWIGIYSEVEAADAGDDGFGDKLKDPSRVSDEGPLARRAFWTARIGQTREFSEGRHDRLFDLRRLPGTPDFLQGGFLIRAGTREPLILAEPDGVLVLHRTRVDEQGRLVLTRLHADFSPYWYTVLPLDEVTNRWELGDQLLLFGNAPYTRSGVSRWHEYLVALDLRTGLAQTWNLNAEAPEPVAETVAHK